MFTRELHKQPSGALGAGGGPLLSGRQDREHPCHRTKSLRATLCRGEVGRLGQGQGPSIPLTRAFFQMIESNDISGEKVRMKETVEGEWLLGWVGPWAFCLTSSARPLLTASPHPCPPSALPECPP